MDLLTFLGVAIQLSARARHAVATRAVWFERAMGAVLVALGARLALSATR